MSGATLLGWLLESSASIRGEAGDWLGPRERDVLAGLSFPKRRGDWTAGRWVAKHAVRTVLEQSGPRFDLCDIQIIAAPDGAPEVFVCDAPAPCAISISHAAGVALCEVTEAGYSPGCDIEVVEAGNRTFLADYFVEEEASFVESLSPTARAVGATLIWSAKESALKSLREGLRRDTRSVIVRPRWDGPEDGWHRFQVECTETGRMFFGWWKVEGRFVVTIGSTSAESLPHRLQA